LPDADECGFGGGALGSGGSVWVVLQDEAAVGFFDVSVGGGRWGEA
jgi:hypothetical protein